MSEVMPEWSGWAAVEPVIDGPEIVHARCLSQWSGEQASGRVVESQSLSKWVGMVLSTLSMRNERIVRMRFGFDGEPPMTFLDIANAVGVKREVVRMAVGRVYQWSAPWKMNVRARVLSDSPSREHRAELALLVERSAIARIDEPARTDARAKTYAAAKARRKRAKIAEAMRLQFRLAMYGKTFFAVSRDAVFALPWERLRRWRWNPWDLRMAQWSLPSLSNPLATGSVVMPYAPDGISTVRFPCGVNLAA